MPSGTSNWTKVETDYLLSVIEKIVPLNPADWDEVKTKFDAKYPKNNRAVSALQRKFQALHRTKEPTGDPNIRSPVLSTQRSKRMIEEKTDETRGSPDSELNLLGGEDDEEEEEDEERTHSPSMQMIRLVLLLSPGMQSVNFRASAVMGTSSSLNQLSKLFT